MIRLYQFDLEAGTIEDIIASRVSIEWNWVPRSERLDEIIPLPSCILQLAPDGKLYNCAATLQNNANGNRQRILYFLGRPNEKGVDCKPSFRFLDSPNNIFH